MRTALAKREVPLTLEDVLIEALARYVEDDYSARFSPVFWRDVFTRWYQEEPESDDDKRWDELFKIGYPALQVLSKPPE